MSNRGTRAGDLARERDEEWSSDCRNNEEWRELAHDHRVDPERAEAEWVEDGAWERDQVEVGAQEQDQALDEQRDWEWDRTGTSRSSVEWQDHDRSPNWEEEAAEQDDKPKRAGDATAEATDTATGTAGGMGTGTPTEGVRNGSWGAEDELEHGEKDWPEAHGSSNAANIFAFSLGKSTRRHLRLGSTGVTSTGGTNEGAETTGAAAEKEPFQPPNKLGRGVLLGTGGLG